MAEVEKMTATAAPPTDIPVTVSNPVVRSDTPELGTSPNQEPSSNSHPHDSEYDTASDLEGGEDYDDEDESVSEEETETEEEDEDDESEDEGKPNRSLVDSEAAAAAAAAQRKVDEDRSNPQYIPKRGTFYEHDDRTAETEGAVVVDVDASNLSLAESNGEINGVVATGAVSNGQDATISQASKTMKKWQPASGGDRWSHDRFEANEQAPKSRAELLQTYGYDIRNEDAPPRARRRRRYGRGPSKYSRNWEDEQAYLKASNKERKPPRPQDFPALNERKVRGPREEKENRRGGGNGGGGASNVEKPPNAGPSGSQDPRDREPKSRHYGRANGAVGRQNAMEFKQKSNRGPQPREREREREYVDNRTEREHQKPNTPRSQNGQAKQTVEMPQQQQQRPPIQQQQQQLPSPPQLQTPLSTTNLSQRLQQVQQRNDPSHVGSVQMHSLASQNQQQQQQQVHLQQQSVAPKRYSSLRRNQQQQEPPPAHQQQQQHLAEQQLQQQLQLQQQQQSQILLQDPHVLMQIAYQQQELQAQLQGLQLGPAPGPNAVVQPPPKQQQQPPPTAAYPPTSVAPYYVTGAEAAPFGNPANATAYLPTTPAAVAYAQAQPTPAQPPPPPTQVPQATAQAQAQAPPPSMNFHQNYNTVGGTTYFVPPAQATSRPSALPQRRPTNAIPILPPSEKHKTRLAAGGAGNAKEEGNSDNIDHIIDNMFVQRPAFQPAVEPTKEEAASSAAEPILQPVATSGQE